MPRPVFNNVETPPQPRNIRPTTFAPTNNTIRCNNDNPPVYSGMDTLGLQTLFNTPQHATLPSKSLRPQHISTPYPRGPLRYPQTPHSPND